MTLRLQKIDDTNRNDHYYLTSDDECYFLYEYTAGAGWRGGDTNQLIHNLQKKRGDGGYNYKASAIQESSTAFSRTINADWLANAVLVPVPPSKIKSDEFYDDRISKICHGIRKPEEPNVKEVINQIKSTETFKGGNRLKPADLRSNYEFNEELLKNVTNDIGIVDDVLTTGSHYRAMKDMILEKKPNARVVGFFVARRAIPNPFAAVSIEDLLK